MALRGTGSIVHIDDDVPWRLRVVPAPGHRDTQVIEGRCTEMTLLDTPGQREIAGLIRKRPAGAITNLAARTRRVAVAHFEVRTGNSPRSHEGLATILHAVLERAPPTAPRSSDLSGARRQPRSSVCP